MDTEQIEAIYPLSPVQQGMLFHTLYAPESEVYFEQMCFALQGCLNVPAFKQAWQRIMERHPILRTAFIWESLDEPLQVVGQEVALPWAQHDWQAFSPTEQPERLEAFLEADRDRGFDLSSAPLMRFTLISMAPDVHEFIWSHHHMLLDGWSVSIVLKEVLTCHAAFAEGREIGLGEVRPYSDYIDWFQAQDLSAAEAFWRQMLKGFTAPTPFRIDHAPSSATRQVEHTDQHDIQMSTDTTAALQCVARQQRLTINTLVQAAWALLLSRYSAQTDVVFGVTVSGRPGELVGVESMVGLFINTLPVRVQAPPDALLLTWAADLQDQQLEIRQYEYSPLVQVQAWSDIPRGLPLFESILVFENYPVDASLDDLGGNVRLGRVRSIEQTNYPLTITVIPDTELLIQISYDSQRFDAATIGRMGGHLQTLLESMATNPERRLADLSLLTSAECQQLAGWNATWRDYPRDRPIHRVIEQQIARTPDALAVVCGDTQLTYQELNRRANCLAHYLQALGVGPEVCVGVCVLRSLDLAVALLGVLKAGGAYLPLDPGYPAERLAFMLEDTQTSVLVTQQRLVAELPAHNARVVRIDADWEVIGRAGAETPQGGATAGNLAYVIYTSGSTGQAKGVQIEHRSLANAYFAWEEAYSLRTATHRHLQMASFSFDVFTGDMVRALCSGGTLVLCPHELLLEPRDLYALMQREQIDCAEFVPVVLRQLIQYLEQIGQRLDFMRVLVCGSDSWYVREYQQLRRLCGPETRLINSFGLTEATIDSTYFECADITGHQDQHVPLGRPFANTRLYLLDDHMQPVPIGVPGELYIGGVGVARGYLNRPDLTAERFVSNPFADHRPPTTDHRPPTTNHRQGDKQTRRQGDQETRRPGNLQSPISNLQSHDSLETQNSTLNTQNSRLYRTGDLARYRPDGTVEYLGRADHQVKVRGFRIELGEIEVALVGHPAIYEAVVLAREDSPGDKRLVAYVVPKIEEGGWKIEDRQPDSSERPSSILHPPSSILNELRAFLKERLPSYMVPATFVFLEQLPLTSNGKIDRRALPAPDAVRPDRAGVYLAPRNPIEELLAGIWGEVLGLERVGIDDHFFELGGHSLLATRIVSRVRDALQIELPLRQLFETPTVASLAARIERAQRNLDGLQAPPITPVARDYPLPLSYAQQRLLFLDHLEPNSAFYNVPAVLRLHGPLDVRSFEQSLTEIVRRHEVLCTTFSDLDGQVVQVVAAPYAMTVPIYDLQPLAVDERVPSATRLAEQLTHQPFDLAQGPLMRVVLLRLDAEDQILVLTWHHIIFDGWSTDVFFDELAALYTSYQAGQPSPLPELPIQYADFAHWQREWLQGAVLETQLAYWRSQLAGAPAVLQLPTDRPRPAVQTFHGATQSFALPASLADSLRSLSRREGATLFMTLLAAFKALLARYTGQDDIVVGMPIAGRNWTEIEGLIGFFVNTLVLRTSLSGGPTFQELLGRVREVLLQAYAHQDLPFERLVGELQPERDMSYSPLFQVMFAFQAVAQEELELPRLTLCPFEVASATTKFDLTLDLEETREGIQAQFEYNSDLFDAATIGRMAGHYRMFLEQIVADTEQPIAALAFTTAAERQQLLVEWNDTTATYPLEQSLTQLFEARVAQSADAVAVSFENQQLTYTGLNRRANHLARYLQMLGVGPEVLVGVYMERRLDLVVALLGVLKAGGAYLPLDVNHPRERLAWMLDDTQAPVIITYTRLLPSLPATNAAQVCLDTDWAAIARQDDNDLPAATGPNNLAYVIYTSGSTGRPKGVLVPHRGLGNLILSQHQLFALTADSCVLQFAALTFDASIFEVMMALGAGARLCLPSGAASLPGPELAQLMTQQGVSSVTLTPTAMAALPMEELPTLQTITVAGEACPPALVARWAPGRHFFNLYGPTETTIWATAAACEAGVDRPPIGRPITNTRVYVLDRNLEPVPVGVPGELYIGGVGLARGYLHRQDLTAEKFVPNPFLKDEGGRMKDEEGRFSLHPSSFILYKTGDLVRYLPDGALEFLGRIDTQVKIRGFRIELGEIETVLSQSPAVHEVAVLAREDTPGEKRLVAYIVPKIEDGGWKIEDRQPDSSERPSSILHPPSSILNELRAFLKQRLPDYMVPAAFVLLDSLPLTSSGKLDRRALPAPETARPDLAHPFVAPRTPIEQMLAGIWAEVLRLDRVGVHDNFFELGGDSILSLQIIARANAAGLRLTARQVFQHRTVADLSAVLETAPAAQIAPDLLDGAVPLTPIQHWFFAQEQLAAQHFNQALLLEVHAALPAALWQEAIGRLLEQHDALRLRFTRTDSGWQQRYAEAESAAPFQLIDIASEAAPRAALEAIAAERQASLDLERGPLARFVLFDLGAGRPARLLIVIHHLVVDGVSWRILLEDLETICRALGRGETPALLPKTTSYKRWAERLAQEAQAPELRREADYWRGIAQGGPAGLPIDLSAADRSNTVASERTVTIELDAEETRALLQEVPVAYRTQINDILLTALALAFARQTGLRRLLVDLEGHGREPLSDDVDLSRTVGWFTAIFPLPLDLGSTHDYAEALKAIKEQLRRIPRGGIGYGILRYLNEDLAAEMRAWPQSDVSFNYLGQFTLDSAGPNLFGPAAEATGSERSPLGYRSHLLDVTGSVFAGRLSVIWTYSENLHRRTTIEGLAGAFAAALRGLIAHRTTLEVGVYTPSDFPLAALDQAQIDRLIGPQQIEDIYPLTPMQEGILFHSLYAPNSGIYFQQFACTLRGDLDVDALRRAWQRLIERHAILRTAFRWEDLDVPLQIVFLRAELPWEQHDWRGRPLQPQRLATFLQADRQRGFDLTVAPLMRVTLIRTDASTASMIWSFQHALLDGWSLPLAIKELFTLYKAFRRGQPLPAKHIPTYREYITWLQRQDMAEAEAFWRKLLQGFARPTPLPASASTTEAAATNQITNAERQIALPQRSMAALYAQARRHELTLNTLVQGAWALLLGRYSGEADVVFGATVSGRPASLPAVEGMIGLFINTLPVRVRIAPDMALLPWLQALQEQQVEARQYEYTPLMHIQGWSEVPRGIPLFESLIVFENYPDADIEQVLDDELTIESADTPEQVSFPLALAVVAEADQLLVSILYDSQRFEADMIERMLGHFQTLLEGMAANPHAQLKRLPLLTEAERRQVLTEWNATAAPYPEACLHQIFEAQAARRPNAIALVDGDAHYTYHELNRRANQLAQYLQQLGIGPETYVAICIERSIEFIVGVLGIIKAGGVYVPLDPSYPTERLAFMLADTATPVVLTLDHLMATLPQHDARTICLDTEWSLIAQCSSDNFAYLACAEQIAYVMYTSGSTGRPKGISIPHQAIARLVINTDYIHLTPADRITYLSNVSFDAATFEIWGALLNGAQLVRMSKEVALSPHTFAEHLREQRISTMFLTTALFNQIASTIPDAFRSLRYVLFGGETADRGKVRAVLQHEPPQHLVNVYGPTENTTFTSWYLVQEVPEGMTNVPIGRPIANTQIYLFDAHMQPVPIGVPGELYVGGDGLARGYLNRPELTAERFVPNPFATTDDRRPTTDDKETRRQGDKETEQSPISNLQSHDSPETQHSTLKTQHSRLYRTGDWARYRADGTIEFLGRIDAQVKIRGFRIELGEIEAVLGQHPTVREVAMLAREDTPGEKRLVAYVAPKIEDGGWKIEDRQPDLSEQPSSILHPPSSILNELRAFLHERLPDYMVPTAFVLLDSMPLTPNGKVDRRALPAPNIAGPDRVGAFVAPRDTVEFQLVRIWEEILEVHPIGITDSFFALGGHSLLSVRLMSRIGQHFGKELPLSLLFEGATIEQMARFLRQEQEIPVRSTPLVPIQPHGSKRPFFCVHPGSGDVMRYFNLAPHLGSDQPLYGLQDPDIYEDIFPETPIEVAAARYIEALRVVQPEGPYLLGGWSFGGIVAFEMAQQLQRQGQAVALLAILDSGSPALIASEVADDDEIYFLAVIALEGARDSAVAVNSFQEYYDELRQLEPDERLHYVRDLLRQPGLELPDNGPLSLQHQVRIFQTRVHITKNYRPQIYTGQVALFCSSDELAQYPDRGWGQLLTQPMELYVVSGYHDTMMSEPHIRELAAHLRECLDGAQADHEQILALAAGSPL